MKRVLISASQFKLSVPGKDVTTAAGTDIAFDGFAGIPYNGVYISGTIKSQQVTANVFQAVVNFGKTFPAVPTCLIRAFDPYNGSNLLRDYVCQKASSADSAGLVYAVSATQLIMECHYSGASFLTQLTFGYLVCQV